MSSPAGTSLINSSPRTEITIHFRTSHIRCLDTPSHRFALRSRGDCNLGNSECWLQFARSTVLPVSLSPGDSWQLERKTVCCMRQNLPSGRPFVSIAYFFQCVVPSNPNFGPTVIYASRTPEPSIPWFPPFLPFVLASMGVDVLESTRLAEHAVYKKKFSGHRTRVRATRLQILSGPHQPYVGDVWFAMGGR